MKKKKKPIWINLEISLHERVHQIADKQVRSASNLIQFLIKDFVEKHDEGSKDAGTL